MSVLLSCAMSQGFCEAVALCISERMDNPCLPTMASVLLLAGGALVELLKKHSGAKAVWLTIKSDGSVTYTFLKPDLGCGGIAVPIDLIEDDKIFTVKQAEAEAFIRSFGLSHNDAEEVILRIGTAP